jgi:hypothetical protein
MALMIFRRLIFGVDLSSNISVHLCDSRRIISEWLHQAEYQARDSIAAGASLCLSKFVQ